MDDNFTMTVADMTKYFLKDVYDIDSMEGKNSIFLKINDIPILYIFLDENSYTLNIDKISFHKFAHYDVVRHEQEE